MTCAKTTLEQDHCCSVDVTVRDGKVHVQNPWFEATADSVTQETPNLLTPAWGMRVVPMFGLNAINLKWARELGLEERCDHPQRK